MPKKPPKKAKVGRPESIIDWSRVDRLLISHCTGVEVAADLGIHEKTLYKRCEEDNKVGFTEYKQSKMDKGKSMLRAAQMDSALAGSNAMLIHLGEHVLGQGKQEEKISPHEDVTAMRHELMMLKYENAKFKEDANAHKPEAGQELCGSDTSL